MTPHPRRAGQSGATLLIVIGIAAALAVMTASLVMVIGNMQSNTADSRTREKAATVGEAAVDGQMYALALNWPKTAVPNPQPTLDSATLRSQFPTSEFPNTTGDFVGAVYYDNADTNGDNLVDLNDAHWDANGDRLLYVEGQGRVSGRAARFQALVERTFVDTSFPHGIAVYDGGGMDSNGGGNNPKITVYNSGGYNVSGYVNGVIPAPEVFDQNSIDVVSPVIPALNQLLPDTTIRQVINLASGMGRYYDVINGAQMPTDLSGICVIRVPDGTTVQLSGGINMAQGPGAVPAPADEPGILLILGPEPDPGDPPGTNPGAHIRIEMANNDRFYGIFITDGQLDFAHGTPGFFGMTVFKSYMDMRGTADIRYDDSAISKLAERWTLSVKLVPNTWREIQPR
ncbi:MAG: hypothetical protein WC709_05425 [Thermoleophilia bacterium]